MSESINWENELAWIGDYRFPLFRRNQSYIELLTEWMHGYCVHIDSCSSLCKDKKAQVKRFSLQLLECHKLYLSSYFAEAYSLFKQTMDEVQDALLSDDFGANTNNYYRIRQGDKPYTYLEMLHIPFSKRQFAATGRFSAPGMPCSYLASRKEICWYECGMPRVFQMASYQIHTNVEKRKLLRLDINPLLMKHDLSVLFRKKLIDNDGIKYISKQLFFVLPLVAMCSVSTSKREGSFVEEYIIPQMLMAWLRNNSAFIGVRYYSYSSNDLVRCNSGHNVAIPVRDSDNKGYSAEICSLFDFSEDSQSETIDLSNKLKEKFSQEIVALESFLEKVTYEKQHFKKDSDLHISCATVELYSKFCSICESLLSLLNDFSECSEQSRYGIILTLAKIHEWGTLLKEHIISHRSTYDESANDYIDYFNRDILELMHSISTFFRMGLIWEH